MDRRQKILFSLGVGVALGVAKFALERSLSRQPQPAVSGPDLFPIPEYIPLAPPGLAESLWEQDDDRLYALLAMLWDGEGEVAQAGAFDLDAYLRAGARPPSPPAVPHTERRAHTSHGPGLHIPQPGPWIRPFENLFLGGLLRLGPPLLLTIDPSGPARGGFFRRLVARGREIHASLRSKLQVVICSERGFNYCRARRLIASAFGVAKHLGETLSAIFPFWGMQSAVATTLPSKVVTLGQNNFTFMPPIHASSATAVPHIGPILLGLLAAIPLVKSGADALCQCP